MVSGLAVVTVVKRGSADSEEKREPASDINTHWWMA